MIEPGLSEWGDSLTPWTDPAPTAAPVFKWQGQSWRVVFQFLDEQDEQELKDRVDRDNPPDITLYAQKLRIAWSIHTWNGKPFVNTVIATGLKEGWVDGSIIDSLEGLELALYTRDMCEEFCQRIKQPLLQRLHKAYVQASGAALGYLEDMEADPPSGVVPTPNGPFVAPLDGQDDASQPTTQPSSPSIPEPTVKKPPKRPVISRGPS